MNQALKNTQETKEYQISATSSNIIYVTFGEADLKPLDRPTAPSSFPSTKKKRTNSTVDPICDPADIQAAKDYFLSQPQRYQNNHTSIRNYTLFVFGCNCARRIGDLLQLTIGDVLNDDYSIRPYISLIEQKTHKPTKIKLNQNVQEALRLYFDSLKDYDLSDYLFYSREGNNQPITTRSAWRIMKDMSRAIGLDKKGINVGTHTMRKTWAYNALNADPTNPNQIVAVSEALNHSNVAVTRRYCGLTQERMDDLFDTVLI